VIIETTGLVKDYGTARALSEVALLVAEGSIYGLVGPNGAGKTTLLAIIAGLRSPTSGQVSIGVDRARMAVLPDTPQFDPWLTGREVVDLARVLSDSSVPAARVDEVLAMAALTDDAGKKTGGYSRGMLQRLGLAATVVAEPKLLLLDEPSAALDPAGRREVLDLVTRMRGEATVLFSSHILSDVQEVCDTVGILDHGNLRFQGPIGELLARKAAPTYRIRLRPPIDAAVVGLKAAPWVEEVAVAGDGDLRISVRSLIEAERHLAGVLDDAGARVISLVPEEVTLEQAFLEVTR